MGRDAWNKLALLRTTITAGLSDSKRIKRRTPIFTPDDLSTETLPIKPALLPAAVQLAHHGQLDGYVACE